MAQATSVATMQVEGGPQLLLAETRPISDLPGLFRKSLFVPQDEAGLVLKGKGGDISRTLGPGKHAVGWAFLGWGARGQAAHVRTRDFTISLHFSRIQSQDYVKLDGFLNIAVRVQSPEVFYRNFCKGKVQAYAAELAAGISGPLDEPFQARASTYISQALRTDLTIGEKLGLELKPLIGDLVKQLGLELQRVVSVAFRPSEQMESLIVDMEKLHTQLASTGQAAKDDLNKVADWLTAQGAVIPPNLRPESSEGQAVLKQAAAAVDAHVLQQAQQLGIKTGAAVPGEKKPSLLARAETFLRIAVPVTVLGNVGLPYVLKDIKPVGQLSFTVFLARAAIPIGSLTAILFGVRLKRLWDERAKAVPRLKLDKWVEVTSLEADEMVRRQTARELANVMTTFKEAKVQAYSAGKRDLADALGRLEDEAANFRTEVERAAFGSTMVVAKSKPGRDRISRMVCFEQDMLHQTRVLADRSLKVKNALVQGAGGSMDDARILSMSLSDLRKTFGERQAHLEGFVYPK
ncbi:MAG: hypothetical protein HYY01_03295 [Chloroflexi bacterium]|nr:hypothetical protein [Chloroflexota bacterium]